MTIHASKAARSRPHADRGAAKNARRGRRSAPPALLETTHKLQKILAQAGLGSRRQMELWIGEGRITVNGLPAAVGQRVGAHDQIKVEGRMLRGSGARSAPRVLLYHKQEGEIVSRSDPQRRRSVFERLPPAGGGKWIAVGRLDFNTCGLLLFTTSGELANRMMHPRFEIEREYAVRVIGRLQPGHMQRLMQGIELEDGPARCERAELRGGEGTNQWCHVTLRQGRNREVRRLFEKLGFTVSRLLRVRYGPLELPPRLKRGQFQELSAEATQRLLAWLDAESSPPSPSRQEGRDAQG